MAKDLSTYRVPHELRVAAAAKARETGVPVTDVLLWALGEFAQGRLPADLVREMSRRPPEPADPPAAPVAPPQGQSAPMERSEPPEPRTDPEPTPERKRRVPARRTAKAAQPEPDAHPESTAEAESEGERITAEIESDPDEVARLRRSRQQARDGETVHWDPEPLAEDWDPAPVPKKDCKHPNMRVKKGFCPDCQTWVSGGR